MKTIHDYLKGLKGKRVAVIGIGVSNTPLIRMLLRAGVKVTARDRSSKAQLANRAEELESLGAELILGEDYLENLNEDIIFRTPGLHPNTKQLVKAREKGHTILSEMELFFSLCPAKIIAVTGSDGKTTTTTIITKLLQACGHNVYLGGNIGKPLLPDVGEMTAEDFAVIELSSFQLMTMTQSPDIAVITNLSPNHLDYHGTMEEYIAAKENIFLYQNESGRTVLNFDNAITRDLSKKLPGSCTFFSRKSEIEEGTFVKDGFICLAQQGTVRKILPVDKILIPGEHNVENYLAAIAAVVPFVKDECILDVAENFGGVEHRIELVRTFEGVRYYNDSIGTSPSRTRACLSVFPERIILIAGGYDKGIPFDGLAKDIVEHVKVLVLTGATASAIEDAVLRASQDSGTCPEIIHKEDFTNAVCTARQYASEGDIVALSPACAAFGQFKNFMERGNEFKEIVNHFV